MKALCVRRERQRLRHRALSSHRAEGCRRRDQSRRAGRTLTNLYNAPPAWLANVHKRLDEAVFAAYPGAPGADLSDDELLALNLERAGKN